MVDCEASTAVNATHSVARNVLSFVARRASTLELPTRVTRLCGLAKQDERRSCDYMPAFGQWW